MTKLTNWEQMAKDSFINGNWSWARDALMRQNGYCFENNEDFDKENHRRAQRLAIARITASFNDDLANQESFIRCLEGNK